MCNFFAHLSKDFFLNNLVLIPKELFYMNIYPLTKEFFMRNLKLLTMTNNVCNFNFFSNESYM